MKGGWAPSKPAILLQSKITYKPVVYFEVVEILTFYSLI